MSEFNIQAATEDGVCHIRLTGRVTFTMSRRFDAFIEDVIKQTLSDIIIDLCKAEHIDSTILGLLAKIARRFIAHHHRKPILLSTSEDINILLDNMGFEAAFDIRDSVDAVPFYLEDIPSLAKSVPMPETLLEAHSELMDLDERNVDRFKTTVETLRDAVKRESS
ncbi:MAG: STAS domain-containing protein [Kiritimatiellae bacterium]|nr:STAS domain-containing protein [Kiritimatiellia bacterium]